MSISQSEDAQRVIFPQNEKKEMRHCASSERCEVNIWEVKGGGGGGGGSTEIVQLKKITEMKDERNFLS